MIELLRTNACVGSISKILQKIFRPTYAYMTPTRKERGWGSQEIWLYRGVEKKEFFPEGGK